MKRIYLTLSAVALATLLMVPAAVRAQKDDKDKDKEKKEEVKKKNETIVITRKGDDKEKMTVVIDGDKITVNGKPIEDLKDGDISVSRHSYNDFGTYRALTVPRGSYNFNWNDGNTLFSQNENTAMLGVTTEKEEGGVRIDDITEGGAAEKAGLKEKDVITKIDDKVIEDPDDLTKAIRSHKPGDKVTVTYLREKKEQKATAELTKWKGFSLGSVDMKGMNWDAMSPKINMQAFPKNQFNGNLYTYMGGGPKLGLSIQDSDDGKGVKVIDVDEEGTAQKAGLKKDDVITAINDKDVNSVDEVSRIVRENREKPSMMVKVNRGGKPMNIEVKMPHKIKSADL